MPLLQLLPAERGRRAGRHLIQQQVGIECGQGGCNHSVVGAAGGHILRQRRLQVAGPPLLVRPQQCKTRVVHILHMGGWVGGQPSGGKRRRGGGGRGGNRLLHCPGWRARQATQAGWRRGGLAWGVTTGRAW